MCWLPLVSLFAILAVASIIEGVFTAPLDVILKSRALKVKPNQRAKAHSPAQNAKKHTAAQNAKKLTATQSSRKITAASLKKSNYQQTALLSPTFSHIKGKVTKITTPNAPPKNKDAGRRYNRPSLSYTDGHIFRPYSWGSDGRQGLA